MRFIRASPVEESLAWLLNSDPYATGSHPKNSATFLQVYHEV
ncbi:Protein of unknown function [Pyronema omphalodes CBS 100304]|uniref:Uncharacterized protein n=1 Tax=Pyronema omphalodes (strain CBS 100304) TaxID=1076935 RepID=U4LEY0_PYROM|nr:Protein of unknown function [Pyronema omphalodes CBS 100304]